MNYPLMLLSVCGCIDIHCLIIDIYDLLIFFLTTYIYYYAYLYIYSVYICVYIYEFIGDIFIWHFLNIYIFYIHIVQS